MNARIVDQGELKRGVDYKTLARLLRRCSIAHVDEQTGYFWSAELLSQILKPERVLEALAYECGSVVSSIPPDELEHLAEVILREPSYLRIFALLLLLSRGGDIVKFVDHGLHDMVLPLHCRLVMGEPELYRHVDDESPVECFALCEWMPHEIDYFYSMQWRLTVPFFQRPGKTATVDHHNLPPQTILPWCRPLQPEGGDGRMILGGFGTVMRVRIDQSCHGLTEYLDKLSLQDQYFAVKSSRNQDHEYFESEADVLKRMAPLAHRHLINILATFSWQGSDHILLPYADYNLWDFWKTHDGPLTPNPKTDMSWIAAQIVGIVDAVAVLHKEHVRHGDIKPENILCFRSTVDSSMNLVLADFGLGRIHERQTQIRGRTTLKDAVTYAYRAPESDMTDVVRSRAFDIWSLGCLFLETAGWILGKLEELRMIRWQNGVEEAFFDILQSGTSSNLARPSHLFRIKPEVVRYISELHEHKQCTQYLHEFLDIIEQNMLVVDISQRLRSEALLGKLNRLQKNAVEDSAFLNSPKPRRAALPAKVSAVPVLANSIDPERLVRHSEYLVYRPSNRGSASSRLPARFSGNFRSSLNRKRVTETQPKRTLLSPVVLEEHGEVENEKTRTADMLGRGVTPDGPVHARPPLNLAQMIDESVSRAFADRPRHGKYDVVIEVNWQLQQYIQGELEGSFDLRSVLTISGNASHSWVASCLEYVKETWPDLGIQFLEDLVLHLRKRAGQEIDHVAKTAMRCELSSAAAEETRPQTIKFKGTTEEISTLGQILAWIAAVFRLPVDDQLSSSSVDFFLAPNGDESNRTQSKNQQHGEEAPIAFRITLKSLDLLQTQEPGSCWQVLFPSSIIAIDFPVPQSQNTYGLQIPFDAMLEMANILDEINLEDEKGNPTGAYFDGISYVLYATAYFEDEDTVQWHVRKKITGSQPSQAPDYGSTQTWARKIGIDTLTRAKAVLGYCGKVEMQLGTKSIEKRFRKYRSSLAPDEEPPVQISVTGFTAGANTHGGTASTTITATKPKALRVAQEKLNKREYDKVISTAEGQWVVLFETSPGQQRAWVVPKLSMILELYNYWALKRKLTNIKYAAPSPNGSPTPKEILGDDEYVGKVVIPKMGAEKEQHMADIVKRIGNALDTRVIEDKGENVTRSAIRVTFGRRPVTGWDWLDLVFELPVSEKKQLPPFPVFKKPNWLPFTKKMPVFFGHNLDQLITPAPSAKLCKNWLPIPGGWDHPYLVIGVDAITALTACKDDRFSLGSKVWELKDPFLFDPCPLGCVTNSTQCRKQPQTLVKSWTDTGMIKWAKSTATAVVIVLGGSGRKARDRKSVLKTQKRGALVFANKRKDQPGEDVEGTDSDETDDDEANLQGANINGADVNGVNPQEVNVVDTGAHDLAHVVGGAQGAQFLEGDAQEAILHDDAAPGDNMPASNAHAVMADLHDASAPDANVPEVNAHVVIARDANAHHVNDKALSAKKVVMHEANMQRVLVVIGVVSAIVHVVLVVWHKRR